MGKTDPPDCYDIVCFVTPVVLIDWGTSESDYDFVVDDFSVHRGEAAITPAWENK